jgi:hypothetical protein
MKKKKISVFVFLEPYLMQWLIHQAGSTPPIEIPPRSPEADILKFYLRQPPKNYFPQLHPKDGQIQFLIPFFRHPDTRRCFYLPKKGEIALRECIKNRFRVQLWRDMNTIGVQIKRKDIAISDWMEAHGIDVTERNWNTIAKILQRKRAIYIKPKKHKKK